jgi:hypothetical protein
VNRDGPGGCWLWTRGTVKGYGQIGVSGRDRIYTHRLSWELHRGPIPEGLYIDHLCRVRACCNPGHLEPVTNQENVRRGLHIPDATRAACHNGHPWDDVYTAPDGYRYCRPCRREADSRYRARRAFRAAGIA